MSHTTLGEVLYLAFVWCFLSILGILQILRFRAYRDNLFIRHRYYKVTICIAIALLVIPCGLIMAYANRYAEGPHVWTLLSEATLNGGGFVIISMLCYRTFLLLHKYRNSQIFNDNIRENHSMQKTTTSKNCCVVMLQMIYSTKRWKIISLIVFLFIFNYPCEFYAQEIGILITLLPSILGVLGLIFMSFRLKEDQLGVKAETWCCVLYVPALVIFFEVISMGWSIHKNLFGFLLSFGLLTLVMSYPIYKINKNQYAKYFKTQSKFVMLCYYWAPESLTLLCKCGVFTEISRTIKRLSTKLRFQHQFTHRDHASLSYTPSRSRSVASQLALEIRGSNDDNTPISLMKTRSMSEDGPVSQRLSEFLSDPNCFYGFSNHLAQTMALENLIFMSHVIIYRQALINKWLGVDHPDWYTSEELTKKFRLYERHIWMTTLEFLPIYLNLERSLQTSEGILETIAYFDDTFLDEGSAMQINVSGVNRTMTFYRIGELRKSKTIEETKENCTKIIKLFDACFADVFQMTRWNWKNAFRASISD